MRMLDRLREWARGFRRETQALWLAARDPRTLWHAKAAATGVVADELGAKLSDGELKAALGHVEGHAWTALLA
jgi:hypothetical protein